MAIPTGFMTWMQMRKMKTRVQQANANAYSADGGLELKETERSVSVQYCQSECQTKEG